MLSFVSLFTLPVSLAAEGVSEPVKIIELSQLIQTLYNRPCNDSYQVAFCLVKYLWEFRKIQQLCKDGMEEGKLLVKVVKDSGGPITMRLPVWDLLNTFYPFDEFEKKEIELCYNHITNIWNELKELV